MIHLFQQMIQTQLRLLELGLEAYTAHASNVRLDVVNNKAHNERH